MEPIPHTQHRPICARANPVVVAHPTPFRKRFNLQFADWDGYSTELEKLIEDVEPITENYGVFVDKVRVASRRCIPRGCRTNHIPDLSEEPVLRVQETICKITGTAFVDLSAAYGTVNHRLLIQKL